MAIRLSGLNSGLDTDTIVSELIKAQSTKVDKYTKAQTKLSWKQDAWKTLNSKIYSMYTKLGNLRLSSGYNLKTSSVSDTTKATVTASSNAPSSTQTLEISQLAKAGYLTGSKLETAATGTSTLGALGFTGSETITVNIGEGASTTDITVDETTTINSLVAQLKSAGLSASFDESSQRFFIASSETGAAKNFTLSSTGSGTGSAMDLLGLSSGTKIEGQDAQILLNGASFSSSTNQFSINGLTINALAETTGAVTVATTTDTQGIYDKIKDFISSYNDIINEMTSLYNADSSKGYEPLTDDEKDAMSDTEIAEWEKKIKDSLLRRDDTLGNILNTMKTSMFSSFTGANGKTYSLSSFGISTLGVLVAEDNEENAFHIDGDSGDDDTSGKADKLLSALATNPDSVIDFMKQLSSDLYSKIGDKMKSTTLSSAMTVYNDKQMTNEYTNYSKMISKWQEKVSDMEDYYYKKFSAMETALANLQSQQSALSGLLGS